MKTINLTPHAVVIIHGEVRVQIPASGQIARISASSAPAGTHEGIPLVTTTYGNPVGLPDAQEGVLLIVSALVRSSLPGRTDLASPSDLVRDASGNIIGCRCLEVNGGAR